MNWRLKKGSDRRFRAGHPWVYSNELSVSPKGIEPGAAVELFDAQGGFLARGYGNPHSLIAFREMTRDPEVADAFSPEFFFEILKRAWSLRVSLGYEVASFRLCFGEADFLPGLVIDRYGSQPEGGKQQQAFVVQLHSAGMDRAASQIVEALKKLGGQIGSGIPTSVVLRREMTVRTLEGLKSEATEVPVLAQGMTREGLSDFEILIRGVGGGQIRFNVDLIDGQKTGFFLDQSANIDRFLKELAPWLSQKRERLQVIDLCCYLGQWSAQVVHYLRRLGVTTPVTLTLVDASEEALERAKSAILSQFKSKNVEVVSVKADVLRDLGSLKDGAYDLVVCDPPALVKSRKDLPQGTHAYLQLNTQALRILARGGAFVSCSCSAQLPEEEFEGAIAKAMLRNKKMLRFVARGGHAADHPVRLEFPEGRYLKGWLGLWI